MTDRYVVVGDSQAEGILFPGAMPTLLGDRLVRGFDHRGWSSARLLRDGAINTAAGVAGENDATLLIFSGGNDNNVLESAETFDAYKHTLLDIVRALARKSAAMGRPLKVVWFGPVYALEPANARQHPATARAMSTVLRSSEAQRVAKEGGSQLSLRWVDSQPLTSDLARPENVHLTAHGYRIYAERALRAVEGAAGGFGLVLLAAGLGYLGWNWLKTRTPSSLGKTNPPRLARPSEVAKRIQKRTGRVPSTLPAHIRPYAEFLRLRQGMPITPRDVIKAYAITRSSVQRPSLSRETLCKTHPGFAELARMARRKNVRPEDVFAAWFFTSAGQTFLDDAEAGRFNDKAAQTIVDAMACWGLQSTLLRDLQEAVSIGKKTPELVSALRGDSQQWIDYVRKHVRGVSLAKAGFLASLLGRGDIATFDARERQLWVPGAAKEWDPKLQDLERFRRRLRAFPLALEPQHEFAREHLVHHALWDAFSASGTPTKTTHGSLIRAMQFAGANARGRR
jgi:hypothetical protein